ncbi:MAG: nucleoside deaminase [Planctomycetes bacterium]|nr:nucleoside deaminase [Planctomycetota bacterium]
MRLALDEARLALDHDDVPVGAVLFNQEGQLLARGHNRREVDDDPTAHAEVDVLRRAASARNRWRLEGTILYVTLEPCVMCAGALVNARVDEVVFGAWDLRFGAAGTIMNLCQDDRLNHRLEVRGGVLEAPCREFLQEFFRARRKRT